MVKKTAFVTGVTSRVSEASARAPLQRDGASSSARAVAQIVWSTWVRSAGPRTFSAPRSILPIVRLGRMRSSS